MAKQQLLWPYIVSTIFINIVVQLSIIFAFVESMSCERIHCNWTHNVNRTCFMFKNCWSIYYNIYKEIHCIPSIYNYKQYFVKIYLKMMSVLDNAHSQLQICIYFVLLLCIALKISAKWELKDNIYNSNIELLVVLKHLFKLI